HMEKCSPYFPRRKEDPPLEVNQKDEFGDGFRASVRCEGIEDTPAGDAIELRKLVVRIHSHARSGEKASVATAAGRTSHEGSQNGDREQDTDIKMESSVNETAEAPRADASLAPEASDSSQQPDQPAVVEERIVWH